ncbi:hypothetical protein [Streptomyces erythrochromogenes]|uniref:hypothetical protein n=1 Tax=Streptomyces erythrochromogenes TaxID=285574 RepID=UPI0036C9C41A
MDSTERPRGPHLEWTVVASDIGPLLLAATPEGLVRVEFHAGPDRLDRMTGPLVSRLGADARRPAPRGGGRGAEPGGPRAGALARGRRGGGRPQRWRGD